MNETIYALATPPGRSAVAIVRISGPKTGALLEKLGIAPPIPRRASVRTILDVSGHPIDVGLVLRFPAPHSYTGEDMAELQVHGGEGVVEGLIAALSAAGLRVAEAGELTRRAFENGKLGLDQAEAVADLIDAQTRAQAAQAARQLQGALGARYEAWRARLTSGLAQLEALIDFPDEEIPERVSKQAGDVLRGVLEELGAALADEARGRRVRDGYRIAIVGAPNAGKSSLFNILLDRDAAIVTPEPGTTRDVLEAPLRVGPYRVILADTAGLRAAKDGIEAEGIRRARDWAKDADLRVWVVDGSERGAPWREGASLALPKDLCLVTKCDLPVQANVAAAVREAERMSCKVLSVSTERAAMAKVRKVIEERVRLDLSGAEAPPVTRERHGRLLTQGRRHLARALTRLDEPELAAEDVRLACRALAQVTGRIGPEHVLEEVFANFCIGK